MMHIFYKYPNPGSHSKFQVNGTRNIEVYIFEVEDAGIRPTQQLVNAKMMQPELPDGLV